MTSSEYWKKRFEEIENMSNEKAVKAANETGVAFDIALRKIEDEIRAWYQRIAVNNEISYTDAIQLLSKNELTEFRWSVEEYIKYGEDNAINQKWLKELENASAKVHITKLEELNIRVQQQIEKVYGTTESITTKLLTEQYTDVAYHTAYEVQKGRNVLEEITKISDKQVQQVLKQTWGVDEKNFSSRIWDQKDKLVNTVKQDLTHAVIRGDSPKDMIREVSKLSKDVKNAKQNAGRLVMTESAVIGSKARYDTLKVLDVEEYEIVSTLDSITSEICRQMDGKHFPMSEFKIGSTAPPFHVNCRTTTCPYFDDEFSQDDSRAYRDKDGKTQLTDSDITYEEWHKKYVDGNQEYALIEKREKNYYRDNIQYEKFVNTLGDKAPSSIDEFQNLKYNDDEWKKLEREYDTILKIKNKESYSDEYRQKLIDTYYEFRKEGYEFTDHSLNRFLGQKSGKAKKNFTKDELLTVLGKEANYYEAETERTVKFYEGISIIQNKGTKEVVSIVTRNKKKEGWYEYSPTAKTNDGTANKS